MMGEEVEVEVEEAVGHSTLVEVEVVDHSTLVVEEEAQEDHWP